MEAMTNIAKTSIIIAVTAVVVIAVS